MKAFIRKLSAFSHLDDEDLKAISAIQGHRVSVAKGVDIIADGAKPHFVNLIQTGLACRYKVLEDGRRQITAYLVPGDLCDLNVYILAEMDHGIQAMTTTQVLKIDRDQMDALLGRPRIALGLLKSTLVDEAVLRQWIVNIGQRTAIESISHLFCEVHTRMKLVGLVTNGTLALPITQKDIGDTVGVTPVHVNRSLQDLRAMGLIELDQGMLTILDIGRLRDLAGFEPAYLHLLER